VARQTILCTFLAPIPVGHRVALVALEYHEQDVGTFGRKMEVDRRWFVVIGPETGVRWGSQHTWSRDPPFTEDPARRVTERYEGVVEGCDVSSHMGSQNDDVWTQLVVDIQRRVGV